MGWIVLSGDDPTVITQRSDRHVLIPTFDYETLCDGAPDCPYVGERKNARPRVVAPSARVEGSVG